jgi:hypothetical protein
MAVMVCVSRIVVKNVEVMAVWRALMAVASLIAGVVLILRWLLEVAPVTAPVYVAPVSHTPVDDVVTDDAPSMAKVD